MGRSRTTSPAKQLSSRAPELALIADNTDLVGAGASGMGGIVKGKRSEWEERTDGIMLMLRAICSKITTNNTQHPAPISYALHVLFVPLALAPDGALDGTAAPVRNPFPFAHRLNTLDRDRIVVSAGWHSLGKSRYYATALTRKRGARHGSAISRPAPELMSMAIAMQVGLSVATPVP
ncbi:hypothetical protein EI94DRAFT_1831974 [Lactarius quietus]|nr:hypothetical protein EI94DRAFT_1831974 [Lactarius quietus]